MYKTVGMVSLGCAKNQVDAEVMLGLLSKEGYQITVDPSESDIIIVNTCGFIGPAKEESIDAILEQIKYKKDGSCKALIVSGCLAERYADDLVNEIPEIDAVVGTGNYTEIINIIKSIDKNRHAIYTGRFNEDILDDMPRIVSTGAHTAYLKIAEGCNNNCSYCIIPKLRGPYRSRSLNSLVREAGKLASGGVKELIVVAQDITRYGKDLKQGYNLVTLLKELCKLDGIEMIRLMYLYPERITDELIALVASEDKICSYLDIPIQHINSRILKKMNRISRSDEIRGVIAKIREAIPEVVLRTSLIVGFPGETEEEFNELAAFVEEGHFNHLGVFPYSREEDTAAALFENQIDDEVKEKRRMELMMIQSRISKKINRSRIGKTYKALVESKQEDNLYYGRTYGEAPGIDGVVYIDSHEQVDAGDIVKVRITKAYEYDLMGDKV